MQDEIKAKRHILILALSETIKELRLKTGKSITLIANEIDISKSIWSDVELAKADIQFSTLFRILEALNVSGEDFMAVLKTKLPNNFSFME